jgi:hypothetical protein
VLGGKDAYGFREILRFLKGNQDFTEARLKLESGRRDISYPLQKLLDQGLVVQMESGRYHVAVPLDTAVSFYEKLLNPRRPSTRGETAEITL